MSSSKKGRKKKRKSKRFSSGTDYSEYNLNSLAKAEKDKTQEKQDKKRINPPSPVQEVPSPSPASDFSDNEAEKNKEIKPETGLASVERKSFSNSTTPPGSRQSLTGSNTVAHSPPATFRSVPSSTSVASVSSENDVASGKDLSIELSSDTPELWRIRNLVVGAKSQWIWVAEAVEGSPVYHQTILTKVGQCPIQEIEKLWDSGYSLKQIINTAERWVVLAEKFVAFPRPSPLQALDTSSKFPAQMIEKAWNEGNRVVFINYSAGMWFVITEGSLSTNELNDSVKPVRQSVVVKSRLPTDELKNIWKSGQRVQTLTYGNGRWVIISEPTDGKQLINQSFYASNSGFPTEKIKNFYTQNKSIHTMVYAPDKNLWALILETVDETQPLQQIHVSRKFPKRRLKELGVTPKTV